MADTDPTAPTGWKARYGDLVLSIGTKLAIALLGALAAWLGLAPKTITVEKVVNVEKIVKGDEPPPSGMGWVEDREAIETAARSLPVQVFRNTPAGQAADIPKAVYLFDLHRKLTGSLPRVKDQGDLGSCVGHGTTTGVERTLAADILHRGGKKEEFSYFSEEVTYVGSRVEANGGVCPIRKTRSNPRGDGSNGGWAARFVTQWGMVPKAKYPEGDLTTYSAPLAESWQFSGVPDTLEPTARKFPVKSAARVTSWEEVKQAIASGYGVQVASSQGFARQRDANGVCKPSGNWAHSMCIDGYHTDTNGHEYGHIENSWGTTYHIGPVGWGNPSESGFWADSDVIDRMARQGDTYAFSGAVGFPARKPLDWALAQPANPRNPARLDRLALLTRSNGDLQCDPLFSLAP